MMEVSGTKPMSQLMSSHSQTSTRKKQGIGKLVVKPHYFTPAEAEIPAAVKIRNDPTIKHYPIPLNPDISLRKVLETQKFNPEFTSNGRSEIDGFFLLEAAKIDFPEDVQHLSITDKKLKTVVDEDLTYFTELFFLDASENYLPFTPFGALPKLKELRIACNRIQKIDEIYGFNQLMYLDLSYNNLTSESILSLSVLPVLKELDLSGNCLTTLPSDMSNFTSLEKIILEYNKFDNNKLFQILGTMPNIRHVDLSHNYLSYIPRECCEYGGLR
jgi:Leucine-rich repeat (LRR) protein